MENATSELHSVELETDHEKLCGMIYSSCQSLPEKKGRFSKTMDRPEKLIVNEDLVTGTTPLLTHRKPYLLRQMRISRTTRNQQRKPS